MYHATRQSNVPFADAFPRAQAGRGPLRLRKLGRVSCVASGQSDPVFKRACMDPLGATMCRWGNSAPSKYHRIVGTAGYIPILGGYPVRRTWTFTPTTVEQTSCRFLRRRKRCSDMRQALRLSSHQCLMANRSQVKRVYPKNS